jgi:RND family efflux transporter MFP subunit
MMIKKFIECYFVISICALTIVSCSKENDIQDIRTVQGAVVTLKEIPLELTGFGALSFKKKVDVASPQDAVIRTLAYREGEKVNKDETLAILENPQIVLAVKRAENALSQAEAELSLAKARLLEAERGAESELLSLENAEEELAESWKAYREEERKHSAQEILFNAGGVNEETIRSARFSLESQLGSLHLSEKELSIRKIGFRDKDLITAGMRVPDEKQAKIKAFVKLATARAQAELEGANAKRDAAEKELASSRLAENDLTILCPFSGVIAARYLEEGERVKREDVIVTMIDTEALCAIIPVRESDAFLLENGMNASVEIDGMALSYRGVVDLISPVADNKSFTFSVRVTLINNDENTADEKFAKPGMFARVSISLGQPRRILALKDSAIINKSNKKGTVFVVQGKTITEQNVVLGDLTGDEWEIIDGLAEGDVAVMHPDSGLKDGEYVSLAE